VTDREAKKTHVEWLFGLDPRDGSDWKRRAENMAVKLDRLAFRHALTQRRTIHRRSNYRHTSHGHRHVTASINSLTHAKLYATHPLVKFIGHKGSDVPNNKVELFWQNCG